MLMISILSEQAGEETPISQVLTHSLVLLPCLNIGETSRNPFLKEDGTFVENTLIVNIEEQLMELIYLELTPLAL